MRQSPVPVKTHKHTERLRHILKTFPEITVTVVGDMVADEFIFGEISRVSREAPVLILKHRERSVVPGGGANAVYNLADLGVNVLPVGVVGNDEPGRMLLQGFKQKHIPLSGIQKSRDYSTVTKTRVLAGMAHTSRQQVVRYDREPVGAAGGPHQHPVYGPHRGRLGRFVVRIFGNLIVGFAAAGRTAAIKAGQDTAAISAWP